MTDDDTPWFQIALCATFCVLLAINLYLIERDGAERGECYGNRTCNAGLVCASETCVRLPDGGLHE